MWRKKLVLHGVRVDDLVGYSENPMAPPPDNKVGFVSASFTRWTAVAGEAGRPVASSTSGLRCRPSGMRLGTGVVGLGCRVGWWRQFVWVCNR